MLEKEITVGDILFFFAKCSIRKDDIEVMEKELTEKTGKKCIVIPYPLETTVISI